ncbi:hypothetical protein P171DRAFT_483616 [Karstenula rhodostoma CBS 690.94]|uniref:Uncharacterized protein n=1 Tax=Karstenula rhodostoma CBS 690.94 TaxID=1392251 RepID=A0A9P4UEA8_9PLEO|nr:hypothetical protein P171DRAFT_483616 [Karstenula rhodostoma CBS 690.94]
MPPRTEVEVAGSARKSRVDVDSDPSMVRYERDSNKLAPRNGELANSVRLAREQQLALHPVTIEAQRHIDMLPNTTHEERCDPSNSPFYKDLRGLKLPKTRH